ncbi:hypothetical protein QFC24_000629 [Naganishia onofrii]|uniref:Uncharacterized protein n=1 Tax=Naganishia onofrii TaxID=1851511 RepID=A0ACC2XY40_9TREE|nr:hypothetical protein QFC24_000629 [Naganishia onofrii]
MPIDLPQVVDPIHETMGKKKHRRQRHHKDKDKDKDKDKGGANTGAGAGKGKHGACDATDKRKDRDRERVGKGKRAESLSDSSSGDSFCLISKDNLRDDSSIHSGKSSVATITSRRQSVSTLHASGHSSLASRTTVNGKTPEELALENTSLRSSLDTLSQRYQALEHELQTYKRNSEQHQEMMKSVVLGVRREAHKAIIQSQILGSMCLDGNANERERADRSGSSAARLRSPLRHTVGLHEGEKSSPLQRIRTSLTYEYADEDPFAMDNDPEDDGQDPVETTREDSVSTTQEPSDGTYDVEVLRRRLQEVEAENQGLKVENQRSRSHLQKYRDRFERMKVSSRAKKEAKLSTGGMQRPSELPTLGEEGE